MDYQLSVGVIFETNDVAFAVFVQVNFEKERTLIEHD